MSIRDTKEARRLIQAMAPEGEFLAFINEREAQMLRDAGGSGIMTLAGIPSFVEYGGISGATASQSQVDSFSGGDDGPNIVDEVALTGRPTVVTGEDQEVDNARMMQALGIPPGVTYSGTNTFIDPFPDRGISVKNILTNAALAKLAKANPKAYAALQLGQGIKEVLNAYGIGASPLSLTRAEKSELAVLEGKKTNADALGMEFTEKDQQRLDELKEKQAEEKK